MTFTSQEYRQLRDNYRRMDRWMGVSRAVLFKRGFAPEDGGLPRMMVERPKAFRVYLKCVDRGRAIVPACVQHSHELKRAVGLIVERDTGVRVTEHATNLKVKVFRAEFPRLDEKVPAKTLRETVEKGAATFLLRLESDFPELLPPEADERADLLHHLAKRYVQHVLYGLHVLAENLRLSPHMRARRDPAKRPKTPKGWDRLRRAAIEAGGGVCSIPGCGVRDHLHAHHRVPRLQGGQDSLDNLVVLCGTHHIAAHSKKAAA